MDAECSNWSVGIVLQKNISINAAKSFSQTFVYHWYSSLNLQSQGKKIRVLYKCHITGSEHNNDNDNDNDIACSHGIL